MRIHSLILIIASVFPATQYAQTSLNKSIPVQRGQNISLWFDYPELIKISTWEGNEILITGTVSINNGENDNEFSLTNSSSGNTVAIKGTIPDIKKLPHRVTVERDGQKLVFKDKAELQKYQQEHGRNFSHMQWGVETEIILDIKIPKNMETRVESVYGMVEVRNFNAPLFVDATYGGVDVALNEKSAGKISAETNFGEIFTNIDAKFSGGPSKGDDFHTAVTATSGAGPGYALESKYGNVYIRKATN